MAGKEAVCLECWPELAHGGAALSTMGCSSTLSACWLAEVSWWGKRCCWGDAGGAPGTRHPCCGSHRPAGHRPEMQAMALSHLHINIAVPLDHLLASMSLMLTAQECTGQGTLWVPPPHSSWVGGSEVPPALGECWLEEQQHCRSPGMEVQHLPHQQEQWTLSGLLCCLKTGKVWIMKILNMLPSTELQRTFVSAHCSEILKSRFWQETFCWHRIFCSLLTLK